MNKVINKIQNRPEIVNYCMIAVIVVMFNLPNLGVDVLILDDLSQYTEAVQGKFRYTSLKRVLVSPFINHIFVKIMAYSPFMARTLILILVMVPLSCLMYYIYKKFLMLPKNVAFFSAVLPQILPGQTHLPSFVMGSYITYALSFYFLAVFFCLKYLREPKYRNLFLAILLYFAAVESSEINIFLAAPLFVLLLGVKKFNRNHFILMSCICCIAFYKIIYTILHPYSTVTAPHLLSIETLLNRFYMTLQWTFPNPGIREVSVIGILIAVLLISGLILISVNRFNILRSAKGEQEHNLFLSDRLRWMWYYLFGLTWFIASLIPYTTSRFFSARYVYPSGFGMCLLMVVSIYLMLQWRPFRKYYVQTIVLLVITISIGIERDSRVEASFYYPERAHASVKRALSNFDFPKDSQVVLVGPTIGHLFTGGYWVWSTGYLNYVTKRMDITGLVGMEKRCYNPFNIKEKGYSYQMHGLDLKKPLFLFRIYNNKYTQILYCLQCVDQENNRIWRIYRLDPSTGEIMLFKDGKGEDKYEATVWELGKLGITKKDIFWSE